MAGENEAKEQLDKLIGSLQDLKKFLDNPEPSSEDVLNALLATQSLSKVVPEVRSATYAIAGKKIEKSEKVDGYAISKVTYKPSPELSEAELARLRVEAPEIFAEVTQEGKQLSEEDKEECIRRNASLMEEARAVNDALHADEMFYHPELKEKYTTGAGGQALAELLRKAGPQWEEVISGWTVKPFIFRVVKSKN